MALKYKARIEELEAEVARLRAETVLLERRAQRAEAAQQKEPEPKPNRARRASKKADS